MDKQLKEMRKLVKKNSPEREEEFIRKTKSHLMSLAMQFNRVEGMKEMMERFK